MNYCNWKSRCAKRYTGITNILKENVIFNVYYSKQEENKPLSIVVIRHLHVVEQILYMNGNGSLN